MLFRVLDEWSSAPPLLISLPTVVELSWTYRPKRSGALASIAPIAVHTIMPFQYGNGLLVTCARISLLTWYEKLRRASAYRRP